jgi:hypothetical protein
MKKVITKFYFDHARYLVGDGVGEDIYLDVNYKIGNFEIVGKPSADLKIQLEHIGHDLVNRKHGVNFSDKIEI